MKFYYYTAVLLGFLIGTQTQIVHSKKLQQCSFYQNVTLTEKTLCKNSTVYPLVPMIMMPYIYVTEILDFNEEEHSITISLQMMLKWNDYGIISTGPKTSENDWLSVDKKRYSDLFRPSLKFWYQRDSQVMTLIGQTKSYEYYWFLPPHYFEFAEHLSLTVGCTTIKFNSYPFDNHQCEFVFYTPDSANPFLQFSSAIIAMDEKNLENPDVIVYHALPFWITAKPVAPFSFVMSGYNYSHTGIHLDFKRNNFGSLLSGFFAPTGLYSLASIMSFAIAKEQVPGRLGLIVTLLLISTNAYNALDAPNDRGVSYIEIWMIGTITPILLALLQFGILLTLEKFKGYEMRMKLWDLIAIILVLTFDIVFQSYFWITVSYLI